MVLDTPININMWKNITSFAAVCLTLIIISCAGIPEVKPEDPSRDSTEETVILHPEPEPSDQETEAVITRHPGPPEDITGTGIVTQEKLASFLLEFYLEHEKTGDFTDFVTNLSGYYIEESEIEGINHDVAFAQMCLETGFLRFGNLVSPDMNNYAGLGATGLPGPDGLPERGLIFPDPRTGVRAHIQHLKAYSSIEPLKQELVNPRFRFVSRGIAPTIQGLTGRWATDPQYDKKITAILERLYEFSFN